MKKLTHLVIAASAVALVGLGYASSAWAQAAMANSKHDLSSGSGATIKQSTTDQICVFCHTPHGAAAQTEGPLWNRTASTGPFTLYDGTTAAPAAESMACLSCHDGTVAFDSLNNYPNAQPGPTYTWAAGVNQMPAGDTLIDGNLTDTHPVSVALPVGAGWKAPGAGTVTLYGVGSDQVECSSCHNPHSTTTTFLRVANTGSALCITCHDK